MKYHIDSVLLAEQSLLGALMQEPEKLIEVKATVEPEITVGHSKMWMPRCI